LFRKFGNFWKNSVSEFALYLGEYQKNIKILIFNHLYPKRQSTELGPGKLKVPFWLAAPLENEKFSTFSFF